MSSPITADAAASRGRALPSLVALAATLLLAVPLALVAPPASAQTSATLTVTPSEIERPTSGNKSVTLTFSHSGCSGCWVELDPGWTDPDAQQAVKGKNGDFGAANRWATDKTIGGKAGKGPVPESFGIKVRPGNLLPAFIRFTLNDSSGVQAEAKVWLNTPGLVVNNQEPQQTEPQQSNQEPEYSLNEVIGDEGEVIDCWIRLAGGVSTQEGYMVQEEHTRWFRTHRWNGAESVPGEWQQGETTYTTRPLRPGEHFSIVYSSYRDAPEGIGDFDFRWKLVSVTDARTGEAMSNFGLPHNTKYTGFGGNAPDKSFTVTYRIEAHPTPFASNTCSATFAVR